MSDTNTLQSRMENLRSLLSRIRILMVLDGIPMLGGHYASFGQGDLTGNDAYFGLSEVVNTLAGPSRSFSEFAITKAHRDTDIGNAADIENFRFDQHDLTKYDEIWLIGVAGVGETNAPMSDSEVIAVANFMDGGGGVFATGDHQDLGVEMNGRIPRVRSMRKWYWPGAGPLGEPIAPPGTGTGRIDTTQPGHDDMLPNGEVLFDDQSDDIPQILSLRHYAQSVGIFAAWIYPHPLLCGPNGAITTFPDHMHEGEVVVPTDFNATLSFSGTEFTEYPQTGLAQTKPEIVAWGNVRREINVSTEAVHNEGPLGDATPRVFGVVGAYDGHLEGVGRVSVDSTWHHFFNINLIGDPAAPAPKNQGFNASPAGKAVLVDIQSYYRNIGTWLARPETQRRHFAAAAWFATVSQPLNMLVRPGHTYNVRDIIQLGSFGLQSLQHLVPLCATLVWAWTMFVEGPAPVPLPDPWAKVRNGDPVILDPGLLLRVALGSAVLALANERKTIGSKEADEAAEIIMRLTTEAVASSRRLLAQEMERYAEGLTKLAASFRTNGEATPDPDV